MPGLWVLAALVSRCGPGNVTHSMVSGYRVAASEDEARGSFVTSVFELKPGFSIDQITCSRVPAEVLAGVQ